MDEERGSYRYTAELLGEDLTAEEARLVRDAAMGADFDVEIPTGDGSGETLTATLVIERIDREVAS